MSNVLTEQIAVELNPVKRELRRTLQQLQAGQQTRQRYGYSRAYRAPFVEAGHLCQTFCLLATAQGLAPFCAMAFSDSAVENDLRIDGISESALYTAGVGARPAHASWGMAPDGIEDPVTTPNPHLHPTG